MHFNQLSEFQQRFVFALDIMNRTGICCYMGNFYQEWDLASNCQKESIVRICDPCFVIDDEYQVYCMKDWQVLNEELYNSLKVRLSYSSVVD